MRIAKPQAAKPSGFTLIELLVVIAIIGVLASMIVAASMRVIGMQSEKNTSLLVQKLANAMYAQWSATVEKANQDPLPQQLLQVYPDPRQARAVYVNLWLARRFPQSYAEALNPQINFNLPTVVTPDPFYVLMLGNGFQANDPQQSGVLLWLMCKNSGNGALFNQDIFTPREAVPATSFPPTVSLFCLVDDWKNPLQFGEVLPGNIPTGRVQGTTNSAGQIVGPGGFVFMAQPDLPAQFYYFPVIASLGPPLSKTQFGPAIISYQLTIGGPIGG